MKASRKEKELADAIDAVLAWWDKHKDDTYVYSIGEYSYDGETFDSDDEAVFERLRKAKNG